VFCPASRWLAVRRRSISRSVIASLSFQSWQFWGCRLLKLRVRRAPTSSPEHAASQPSNSSSKRTAAPPLNSGVSRHKGPSVNLWRFRALFSWLGELRYAYLAVLYVLLGASIVYCFGASERSIRFVGGGLQVLGIGTVAWGISLTRKQFGHQPIYVWFYSWLRRCPLIRRTAHLNGSGITMGISVSGRLTEVFTPSPDASVEERLSAVERGMGTVQKRIGHAEAQIDQEIRDTHNKIAVEARAREGGDRETMSALESASTGGVHVSAIGALWLFVGVILSTASSELSSWFR